MRRQSERICCLRVEARLRASFPPEPDHASDDSFVRECQQLANWINEWIDARDRDDIDVQFVFFSEATNDLEGTMAKMFPERVPSRLAPRNVWGPGGMAYAQHRI